MGVKISELPANTLPYTGSEEIPIVQSNETRASTLSSFVNYLSGALLSDSELASLSGNWQNTYTTFSSNSSNFAVVDSDNVFQSSQSISGNLSASNSVITSSITAADNLLIIETEGSDPIIRGNPSSGIIKIGSSSDEVVFGTNITANDASLVNLDVEGIVNNSVNDLTIDDNVIITGTLSSADNIYLSGAIITEEKVNEWDSLYNGPVAISLPSGISNINMYPGIYINWGGNNTTWFLSDIIDSLVSSLPSSGDIIGKGKFTIVNSSFAGTSGLSLGRGNNFISYIGTTSDMTQYTDYLGTTIANPDGWCIPHSGIVNIQLYYQGSDLFAFIDGNILSTGGTPDTSGGGTTLTT